MGNLTLPVEPYGELLRLLPQMMASASSASEIVPVLAILFELVRGDNWLRVVNDDEGALFESVQKVPLKELDLLRRWAQNHQYLIALNRVFLALNQPFHDFVSFGEEVYQRYRATRSERSARRAAPPGEMASTFLRKTTLKSRSATPGRFNDWNSSKLTYVSRMLGKQCSLA